MRSRTRRRGGAEPDLALIAGFSVILLADAGRISLDHTLAIETGTPWEALAAPRRTFVGVVGRWLLATDISTHSGK